MQLKDTTQVSQSNPAKRKDFFFFFKKQSKEDLFQTSSAADERREEDATGGIGSTRARERQKQPKGEAITSHHSPSQSPLLTLFRGDDVE